MLTIEVKKISRNDPKFLSPSTRCKLRMILRNLHKYMTASLDSRTSHDRRTDRSPPKLWQELLSDAKEVVKTDTYEMGLAWPDTGPTL